jgi:signal transduction histidine kinase
VPVLDRIGPPPFECFDGLSEDHAFSKRARGAGLRLFVAKDIVIAHVDAVYQANRARDKTPPT